MAKLSKDEMQELLCDKNITDPLERAGFIYGFRTAESIHTKGDEMKLKVKKLHPDAIIPKYQTEGAACFDLHAICINGYSLKEHEVLKKAGVYKDESYIEPESSQLFRTGLSFEIPNGYVMMVYSRSGHGFKNSARLANCVGVIDSDYTGEVMVKLSVDHAKIGLSVTHGSRIAQAMLIPVNQVTFEEVDELKETERGAHGFGSTGA